jgi:hypothetical protein
MAWGKGCCYLRWMELTSKLARTDIRVHPRFVSELYDRYGC